MSHILETRVAETTTSTGTGDVTLGGALTAHRAFADVCGTGDTTEYVIYAVDTAGAPTGDWEEGKGTYSAANTLTRTAVTRSSNSNSAVTFTAGTKIVILTPLGSRVGAIPQGGNTGQVLSKSSTNDMELAWIDTPASVTVDAAPTDGSSNAVSSNGVFDALALKSDTSHNHSGVYDPAGTAASAVAAHAGTGGTAHANAIASGAAGFMTGADKAKLDGIEAGATVAPVASVAGRTGAVTLTSADLTDATAAGRALLDDATAADQRTTLGLGDAATKSVGTTAGTVCAGDDARLSNERVPTEAGMASKLHAAAAKTTLVDADEVNGTDSAASWGLIRTTWANVTAYIKSKLWAFNDSSTTNAINLSNGLSQRWAPATGAQTLSFTNWPASGQQSVVLIEGVNLSASTITWPTINWVKKDGTFTTTIATYLTDAGITLQSSGTDFFMVWSRDGGTTVYGKFLR